MSVAAQTIGALALGVLGYMVALCLAGMYDGIMSLLIQPFLAGALSALALLVIAPCGLLLRRLPFARGPVRGSVLCFAAILLGMNLLSLSSSPGFAIAVQGPEVQELQLHAPTAVTGWIALMVAPFLLTAGRVAGESRSPAS